TSLANQTTTNATSLANQTTTNATSLANQTTTNATSLANQNTTNATSLANQTTTNETTIANQTNTNETSKENKTNTKKTKIENQTSESKPSEANSLPKAFDQSVSLDQNNRIDINLVADDEDKDHLQFDITADPLHGSLDNFNKEKGTVTYMPQKDYSGDDKFRFRVSDNKGGQSDPANVDIKINTASQSNETKNTDTGAAKSEKL